MARPSLSPGEKMTTISFRANPASIRRILSAIGDRGVKKSEVFRILIEEASDAAISRAIKKAELEQLKVLSSLSVNDPEEERSITSEPQSSFLVRRALSGMSPK